MRYYCQAVLLHDNNICTFYLDSMGRKKVDNKKTPSEYPQIAFRVSKEDKKRISDQIEKVQAMLNKRREVSSPFLNKNDIFVMALNEGLKKLK